MAEITPEQLVLSRDPSSTEDFIGTKVESVKIYRLAAIDRIRRSIIPEKGSISNIPNDVDDFEVPDEIIQAELDKEKPDQTLVETMRAFSKKHRLNWQRTVSSQYYVDLKAYITDLRRVLAETNQGPFTKAGERTLTDDDFIVQEVKEFATIGGISRGLNFDNTASVNISIQELIEASKEIAGPLVTPFVPRENDILEIVLRYPGRDLDTVFLGLISGVQYSEEKGTVTTVAITASGLSKLLSTNKMITDRAIVNQFENGTLSDLGIVVWSSLFALNTADEIFNSIMVNQLAMSPETTEGNIAGNDGAKISALLREEGILKNQLRRPALTEINQKLLPPLAATKHDGLAKDLFKKKKAELLKAAGDRTTDEIIADVDATILDIRSKQGPIVSKATSNADPLNKIRDLIAKQTFVAKIDERLKKIAAERESISTRIKENPADIVIDYKFDPLTFMKTELFQFAHIPFTTLAAFRTQRGEVVAKFKGRRAFAFDQAIRSGFELYFSQLGAPSDVLDAIRMTAKHVVYENEKNQIVAEIPRYNEFVADDGEEIEDFIITNPLGVDITRQDLSMVTRIDTKTYFQFIGQQPFVFLSGQYTDIAILSRYGMRAEAPIYNPNARSPQIAALFSSVEVADRNAQTRTLSVSVPADRPFRIGRLYFLMRKPLEKVAGGPLQGNIEGDSIKPDAPSEEEGINGYVGYLANYSTSVVYGAPITHELKFTHVRRSKLLFEQETSEDDVTTRKDNGKIAANFKILPDIRGVIDALEEATKKGEIDPNNFRGKEDPPPNQFPTLHAPITSLGTVYYATLMAKMTNIPETLRADDRSDVSTVAPFEPRTIEDRIGLPVIQQAAVEGGVSQSLIQTTHLMDLRIRSLNEALFTDRGFGEVSQFERKSGIFDVLFMPNDKVNSEYRITNFRHPKTQRSFKVIFLQVDKVIQPFLPIDATVLKSADDLKNIASFQITESASVKVSQPYSFAMLKADIPFSIFGSNRFFQVNGETVKLASGTQFQERDIARVTKQIESLGLSPDDESRLITEFSTAARKVKVTLPGSQVLLPVIFVGDQDHRAVVQNTSTGTAFTLLEIAHASTKKFPGGRGLSPVGPESTAHRNGDAIDLTVVPWYGVTGYTLRAHSPYLLSDAYDPRKDGHLHGTVTNMSRNRGIEMELPGTKLINDPGALQFVDQALIDVVGGGQKTKNLFDMKLKVIRKDDPKNKSASDAAIEACLNDRLRASTPGGFTATTFTVNDLVEDDRFWYHLETSRVLG